MFCGNHPVWCPDTTPLCFSFFVSDTRRSGSPTCRTSGEKKRRRLICRAGAAGDEAATGHAASEYPCDAATGDADFGTAK